MSIPAEVITCLRHGDGDHRNHDYYIEGQRQTPDSVHKSICNAAIIRHCAVLESQPDCMVVTEGPYLKAARHS